MSALTAGDEDGGCVWDAGSAGRGAGAATGAVPQRPRTQPPTRRVMDGLRAGGGRAVGVFSVSWVWLWFRQTDASRLRGECGFLVGASRSAVTVVVAITGGVEYTSPDEKLRRWIPAMGIGPGPPVRERRRLGVWMSMPATDSRLS